MALDAGAAINSWRKWSTCHTSVPVRRARRRRRRRNSGSVTQWAFLDKRWLAGNVARRFDFGCYEIIFSDGSLEFSHKGLLRRRLDWVHGEWVAPANLSTAKEEYPKSVDATNKASEPTSQTIRKRRRSPAGNTKKSKFNVYSSLKGRENCEANLESQIRHFMHEFDLMHKFDSNDSGCSKLFADDDIGEPAKNMENRSGSFNGILDESASRDADEGNGEHANNNKIKRVSSDGYTGELATGNGAMVLGKHVSSHSNHELATMSASGKAISNISKTVCGQFNPELALIEELRGQPLVTYSSVKMTLTSVWDALLSQDVFKAMPQCPHFRSLEKIKEDHREGIAIGLMANFVNFADKLRAFGVDDSINILAERLDALEDFEQHGFNVEILRHRITDLIARKRILENATQEKSLIVAEITQNAKKCSESACVVDDINSKLKELEDRKLRCWQL